MPSDNDEVEIPYQPVETDDHHIRESSEKISALIEEKIRRVLILEPAVFLMFFAMNLSGTVFQNQVIYQTCISVFLYNQSECALLGTSDSSEQREEIETNVQPYAANIFMVQTVFDSIIPAVGGLFIGPWSDRFGRKPVMLAAFMGYCASYTISSVIAFISTKSIITPWLYILGVIPVSICGGICSFITGVLCFVTDVSVAKDRAYGMVIIEAAIFIGLMLGSLLSSYLLAATNCATVLLISALLIFLAILYICIFIKESLRPEQIDQGSKLRGLFRWELVEDMLKTCFEQRPNYDRMIIWLTMITLSFNVFVMGGNTTVFFLFVREKFMWTVKDYTFYDAASILIQIFGNVIVVYVLQKILKLSITSLALIAFGSCCLDAVIKAFALYPWHLYLAIGVSTLKAVGSPMCRAILSQVIPASDIGKIFSLTTSIETITPLASSPLYSYVYSSTLTIYPGAFNFISAGMFFICYILLAIVFGIQKSFPQETYAAIGS